MCRIPIFMLRVAAMFAALGLMTPRAGGAERGRGHQADGGLGLRVWRPEGGVPFCR